MASPHLTALVLLCLACASAALAAADFRPLDPAKTTHPAAEAAPAASPLTYPDEDGLRKRREALLDGLVKAELGGYRLGFFRGGDPGKYLPLNAMARLLRDPGDAEALKYMNDERAPTEHYHFAAVNWARFLPLFGAALTDETRKAFASRAGRAGCYINTGAPGTDNHKVMQLTSGVVLPDYLDAGTFAGRDKAGAQAAAKNWLRWYVKGLYARGQSEWDSSTYMLFDINGFLNVYDFSKDEECRLLARAALDWLATSYALKYVNGMHTGPKERGWTHGAYDAILDQAGWLWWGGTRQPTPEEIKGFRYAVHAATSSWRPNRVLCNIARRNLPSLPAEFRNSKPDYWHGLDKSPHARPIANLGQESLYLTRRYTLGTMWYDPDTCTQLTRMQLGAATLDGAVAFTGSAPGTYNGAARYTSGQGTHITRPGGSVDPKTEAIYVQYAQAGPVVICMAEFPPEAKEQFTYFSTPVEVKHNGRFYFMCADQTYLAVLPLTDKAEPAELGGGKGGLPALRLPGPRSGWVLVTGDADSHGNFDAFEKAVLKLPVDTTAWQADMKVAVPLPDGRKLAMQYARGRQRARAWLDDRELRFDDWPVYDGPYVTQKDGVLSVNDGREGFVLDFSGEVPAYKPWAK